MGQDRDRVELIDIGARGRMGRRARKKLREEHQLYLSQARASQEYAGLTLERAIEIVTREPEPGEIPMEALRSFFRATIWLEDRGVFVGDVLNQRMVEAAEDVPAMDLAAP